MFASRRSAPSHLSTSRACAVFAAGAGWRWKKRQRCGDTSNTGMTPAILSAASSNSPPWRATMSRSATTAFAAIAVKTGRRCQSSGRQTRPARTILVMTLILTATAPAQNPGHGASSATAAERPTSNCWLSRCGTSTTKSRSGRSGTCRTFSGWNTSNWRTSSPAATAAMPSRPGRKRRTGRSSMTKATRSPSLKSRSENGQAGRWESAPPALAMDSHPGAARQ